MYATFKEALGLFLVALFLALVEIEIEGKYGWAEKIPTWYRTTGFAGKLWGLLMNGKPLTGYHLFLNGMLLAMFHLRFFQGAEWSVGTELTTLARFFAMAVFWDFLWFVLNPNYTILGYRKNTVWWFSKSRWVFGFPVDYAWGLGTSVLLAFLSGLPRNGISAAKKQFALIYFLALFTSIAIMLSPFYGQWYEAMRKRDDRNKAGIPPRLP